MVLKPQRISVVTMDSGVEASENIRCDDGHCMVLKPQRISVMTMDSGVKASENIRCDDGQWC